MTRDEWFEASLPVAKRFLRSRDGHPFLAEHLLPLLREQVGEPPDARNAGPFMRRLEALGLVARLNYGHAKTSHGSPKRRWAPLIGRGGR